MDGVEVMMWFTTGIDRKLKEHAEGLVKSTGLPVHYVLDPNHAGSEFKFWGGAMLLSAFNYQRTNIAGPKDVVESLRLPVITNEYDYAIVMHELGHTLLLTTAELEAWQWAYDHSPIWSHEMHRAATYGLLSYVSGGHFTKGEVDKFLATLVVKGVA